MRHLLSKSYKFNVKINIKLDFVRHQIGFKLYVNF